MTTEEKLVSMCIERGMFEDDAKLVVNLAKETIQKAVVDYKVTWDRSCTEYDPAVINMLFLYVRVQANKFINDTMPNVWYKVFFEFPDYVDD